MVNIGNTEGWKRVHGLRSSNAAMPHKNKKREAKKGFGKGGRPKGWTQTAS
ncbi:MAG: hypothetical protein LBK28_03085 [Propionibacteriaceae bacterium]|jgi:hypothetical protein|nr:hypothetical protein [Propionibacteriaceae bacterium]